MQSRQLVNDRAQRNLLLLIDGKRSADVLLQSVKGVSEADFDVLQALGLIATSDVGSQATSTPLPASTPAESTQVPLNYAEFTAALTQLISSELGLRGFLLTLAVDKASTTEELTVVATKVIDQIRERKGLSAAASASHKLYGQ